MEAPPIRFVPHWRKMTWVIIVFTVLMAIWAIAGGASADNHAYCVNHHGILTVKECESARDTGTGIGVILIFLLWAIGFVVLSLIWFMTRPKGRRDCPVCGHSVKRGEFLCTSCGYDFRTGHQTATTTDARFDPTTGTPLTPQPRFDPQAGQPVGRQPRFDPYTGKPLDS